MLSDDAGSRSGRVYHYVPASLFTKQEWGVTKMAARGSRSGQVRGAETMRRSSEKACPAAPRPGAHLSDGAI